MRASGRPTLACDAGEQRSFAMRAELEREYNMRTRHPERETVYRHHAALSEALRARAVGLLDERYAPGERCLLDLFVAPRPAPDAPLLVFLHGGYWRALDKSIFSFIAGPYLERGVSVAMPTYDLAPKASVTAITGEALEALRWLARNARALGVSTARVVVAGHSAGGHLAAMAAAQPPESLAGVGLHGLVAISGLFELEPLLYTNVNADVRMSVAEARAQSPLLAPRFALREYLIAVGALETEGFQQQSRQFDAHLRALGLSGGLRLSPGRTHFDILDDFARPGDPLFERTLAMLLGACGPA